MTVRSMTGYGSASVDTGGDRPRRYRIQLRSVNHRFLDVKVRIGRELTALESRLIACVKHRLERGHVDVTVDLEPGYGVASGVTVDVALAIDVREAIGTIRSAVGSTDPVTLGDVLQVGELISVQRHGFDPAGHEAAFDAGMEDAIDALVAMRAAEGVALGEDLQRRVQRMRDIVVQLRAHGPRLVSEHRERLRARVMELLSPDRTLDDARIEHEVAIFADKSDVSEELTRLVSHLDQFHGVLTEERTDGHGKRLGFLTQELLREVNTVGSKIGDASLTALVIDAKCEIEKVREQVANLE